jgi:hypothetical protein
MTPTLPYLGGAGESRSLLAGMTFLEVTESGRIDLAGLSTWLDDHVVATGCMARPSVVLEPPAGTVALRPGTGAVARANADLPRVISTARLRVVDALRGLIASPSDDRFLRAGIFLGRVRRQDGRWVARPEATAPLSGIVLSLFAVPVLSERTFFDRQLCVCDTCGRVSFDATPGRRHNCPEHAVRVSGVSQRALPASAPPESSVQPIQPASRRAQTEPTRKTGLTPR